VVAEKRGQEKRQQEKRGQKRGDRPLLMHTEGKEGTDHY